MSTSTQSRTVNVELPVLFFVQKLQYGLFPWIKLLCKFRGSYCRLPVHGVLSIFYRGVPSPSVPALHTLVSHMIVMSSQLELFAGHPFAFSK